MTTPKFQSIIQNFVAELSAELDATSHTAISAALGGASESSASVATRGRPVQSGRRAKGGKRSPEELTQLTQSLVAYVKRHPGQRIEQIGKALGTSTKELALPAKKLIGEKRLATKGQKRATTYFSK